MRNRALLRGRNGVSHFRPSGCFWKDGLLQISGVTLSEGQTEHAGLPDTTELQIEHRFYLFLIYDSQKQFFHIDIPQVQLSFLSLYTG